jgi:hypothetical protein
MPLMGEKKWYQSKAIWTGIVAVLVVAYNTAGEHFLGLPPIPEFVYALLAALGVYGRAVATERVVTK